FKTREGGVMRLENLIREMLEISRMEAGATAVCSETVELAELLRRQLALYEELFRQRGQRLTAALTPGAAVSGDPALLGRAAGNLLSNAALYSAEGAEIRVWCGLFEGQPALTVENTGAHISEAAQPHLFEAFYRGECSRSRATGGSGLGLYLVQMISARHGASCSIENTAEGVRAVIRFAGGVEL
ncbi:MAG: sensor histidine kinase, partial [Acutalibacteraceae bacterium]